MDPSDGEDSPGSYLYSPGFFLLVAWTSIPECREIEDSAGVTQGGTIGVLPTPALHRGGLCLALSLGSTVGLTSSLIPPPRVGLGQPGKPAQCLVLLKLLHLSFYLLSSPPSKQNLH